MFLLFLSYDMNWKTEWLAVVWIECNKVKDINKWWKKKDKKPQIDKHITYESTSS